MKIQSEFIVCKTVNPEGRTMLVEITKLMLLEVLYYDFASVGSDEIDAVKGWLTVIGTKAYRVTQIPPETVHIEGGKFFAIYQVMVNWDDLERKPS